MKKFNSKSRRQFFKLTSISVLGYGVLSLLPFNIFKKSQPKKLRSVSINSNAVKRK